MFTERAAIRRVEHEAVILLRRHAISAILLDSDESIQTLNGQDTGDVPQLALIEVGYLTAIELNRCIQACVDADIPSIALVPSRRLPSIDPSLPISDLIVSPPDPDELVIRAQRALIVGREEPTNSHIIEADELQIDTSSYEVTLRGERIGLRFKEYELLKLLAENPGRVFSREVLLNRVWGYEYFGGTRTVDVHVRRLRSKIEDADHNFIETIWNVGYRFRDIQ